MSAKLIKPGPKSAADLAVVPVLSGDQLGVVRTLAKEGVREMSLRRVLGLTPAQWKALRADLADGDLSPLSLALAEGLAEGQTDIINFMKRRMTDENDFQAASWLADRVFKLGRQESEDGIAPRVSIVINAAMTPEEYARMIEVTR